jgi:hypothetical protein
VTAETIMTLAGETNTGVIARHSRPKDGVASARLCRATQYSRDAGDRSMGRGVLDRPVKPGDDSFGKQL